MPNLPKSYIAIDGLRIEGDSRTVMTYMIAVRNALVELHESGKYGVWVGADGAVSAESNGDIVATGRHTQSILLRPTSSVSYQIIEDDYSTKAFDDGTLGTAGKDFMDSYYPSDEAEDTNEG